MSTASCSWAACVTLGPIYSQLVLILHLLCAYVHLYCCKKQMSSKKLCDFLLTALVCLAMLSGSVAYVKQIQENFKCRHKCFQVSHVTLFFSFCEPCSWSCYPYHASGDKTHMQKAEDVDIYKPSCVLEICFFKVTVLSACDWIDNYNSDSPLVSLDVPLNPCLSLLCFNVYHIKSAI